MPIKQKIEKSIETIQARDELKRQKTARRLENRKRWMPDLIAEKKEKDRKKANRKTLRNAVKININDTMPYTVALNKIPLTVDKRTEMRAWFAKNHIRTAISEVENPGVMWDKTWRVFRFREQSYAVLFNLTFG